MSAKSVHNRIPNQNNQKKKEAPRYAAVLLLAFSVMTVVGTPQGPGPDRAAFRDTRAAGLGPGGYLVARGKRIVGLAKQLQYILHAQWRRLHL